MTLTTDLFLNKDIHTAIIVYEGPLDDLLNKRVNMTAALTNFCNTNTEYTYSQDLLKINEHNFRLTITCKRELNK